MYNYGVLRTTETTQKLVLVLCCDDRSQEREQPSKWIYSGVAALLGTQCTTCQMGIAACRYVCMGVTLKEHRSQEFMIASLRTPGIIWQSRGSTYLGSLCPHCQTQILYGLSILHLLSA